MGIAAFFPSPFAFVRHVAALAKQLGYDDAIPLLQATLEEEKSTDKKLTMLAEGGGNQRAARQAA